MILPEVSFEMTAGHPPAQQAESHDKRGHIDEPRDENDGRAGGKAEMIGDQQPVRFASMAASTAMPSMVLTSSLQSRAVPAGSIMIPTTSSVPSAWKPATRFSTTSARKPSGTTRHAG